MFHRRAFQPRKLHQGESQMGTVAARRALDCVALAIAALLASHAWADDALPQWHKSQAVTSASLAAGESEATMLSTNTFFIGEEIVIVTFWRLQHDGTIYQCIDRDSSTFGHAAMACLVSAGALTLSRLRAGGTLTRFQLSVLTNLHFFARLLRHRQHSLCQRTQLRFLAFRFFGGAHDRPIRQRETLARSRTIPHWRFGPAPQRHQRKQNLRVLRR